MRHNRQSGYTILEIPIALFIVGVVLLLYAAASNTVLLNRNAKYQDAAVRIGSSLLEDLRGTAFDSLPTSGNVTHPMLSQLPASQATMTVTPLNDDTREITVQVRWREAGSKAAHTVSLTTLITRNGL